MTNLSIAPLLSIIIILIHQTSHLADGLRILGIFPYQANSHSIMCVELMKNLAKRGHAVDVYSHFPLKENLSNYNDFSLKGTLPEMTNKLTYDEFLQKSTAPWNFVSQFLRKSTHSMCQLLDHPLFQKLLREPPNDPPYDLVIIEYCQTHCYIPWGRFFNVPIIGLVPLPTLDWIYGPAGNPVNLAVDPSVFSPYAAPMNFFERVTNVVIYYTTSRIFDNIIDEQDQYIQKYFGPEYPSAMELSKDFSLILLNHNPIINGIKLFTSLIVPVGGLHIVDDNETLPKVVQKWLDDSEQGCIYFSFGSMIRIETFPKHILDSFYKTFENIAPVRILWKIAVPEVLPNGLPSNVITYSWLPQIQVLKHKNIKMFITHGGLMGTQESIYFGVPMVIIPLFGDQYINADSYSKKSIAIRIELDDLSEQSLTAAVKKILSDSTYIETTKRISKLFKDRPMSAMDTAVYWIDYVSRNGNDTLKSPLAQMSWSQSLLLDVYGFIITVIAIVLYVSIKLLKPIIKFIFIKLKRSLFTTLMKKKTN